MIKQIYDIGCVDFNSEKISVKEEAGELDRHVLLSSSSLALFGNWHSSYVILKLKAQMMKCIWKFNVIDYFAHNGGVGGFDVEGSHPSIKQVAFNSHSHDFLPYFIFMCIVLCIVLHLMTFVNLAAVCFSTERNFHKTKILSR